MHKCRYPVYYVYNMSIHSPLLARDAPCFLPDAGVDLSRTFILILLCGANRCWALRLTIGVNEVNGWMRWEPEIRAAIDMCRAVSRKPTNIRQVRNSLRFLTWMFSKYGYKWGLCGLGVSRDLGQEFLRAGFVSSRSSPDLQSYYISTTLRQI